MKKEKFHPSSFRLHPLVRAARSTLTFGVNSLCYRFSQLFPEVPLEQRRNWN